MFKKIIMPILVIVGLATMAFYTDGTSENEREVPVNEEKTDYDAIVVLELFTSQGCSSCPPADVLLNQAKVDFPKNVFALSYHVDYWNYIGWEDPFSNANYTKKQRAYNLKFKSNSNYTPEMVVNGREHFVGSNQSKLKTKINQYAQQKVSNKITLLSVSSEGRELTFDYQVAGDLNKRQLRAVLVLNERTTAVKRGENRNRVLKNSNIVVVERYLDFETARGSGSITVPSLVTDNDNLTLLLISENENHDITGAVKTEI